MSSTSHAAPAPSRRRTPVPTDVPTIIQILGPVSRSLQELIKDPRIELGPWTMDLRDHQARIELGLEAEIYKSQQPDVIYLRLTTIGNGVANGGLKVAERFQRGPFQDLIWVQFGPVGELPAGTGMLGSSPQTLNKTESYTATTGFEIGFTASQKTKISSDETGSLTVEAGAHATFQQSNSVTTTLRDFEVLNKSASNEKGWAFWEFGMTRCGANSEGSYDRYNPTSLVDSAGAVWEVPMLAVSTLFPACQGTWKFPHDFKGTIDVKLDVYQRLTTVQGSLRVAGHVHPRMIDTFKLDFAPLHGK